MIRAACALIALCATVAASPPPPLPVPPIPPANIPSDRSAPLPDRDFRAPLDTSSQGVRVMPEDFRIERYYQGLAFGQGSHFSTSEEKRSIQTPGVAVQVPIQ
jgi:hypothetical protein